MSQRRQAVFGAIGALAPDVLMLYSKRLIAPAFEFMSWQFVVATLLYVGLGATVAAIFPLKGRSVEWKAFALGFGLPVVLGGILTAQRGPLIAPRGETDLPGSLADLMALF